MIRLRRRQSGQVVVEFALVAAILFGFIFTGIMALLFLAQNFTLGQAVERLGNSIVASGSPDTASYVSAATQMGSTIDPATDTLFITVTPTVGAIQVYTWGDTDFQVSYGDLIAIEASQTTHGGMFAALLDGVSFPSPTASWNGIAQRNSPDPTYIYTPPPNVGDISGTIRDAATGKGIGGVIVTFSPGGRTATSISSGCPDNPPCGRYGVSSLPSDTYTVSTSTSGYQPASASVTVNQGSVSVRDLYLGQAAIIEVTVTGVDAVPIEGAIVTTGSGLSAVDIGSGQYRLLVNPGPVTISANMPPADGRSGNATISNAAAGSTTSLTIIIE